MRKGILAVLVVLALAALACSMGGGGGASGGENTDPGTDSSVLLQDDFSDTGSGWDRSSEADALTDYEDGAYRIYISSESYSAWANPNQSSYTDVSITVDARKVGGPDDNEFGIVCRHADPNNYYAFIQHLRAIVDGQAAVTRGSIDCEQAHAIP